MDTLAAIKPKKNSGDFTKDGILYCGECGEPKQAWIDWMPDEDGNPTRNLVRVMCRCDIEAERMKNERKAEERFGESLRHYNLTIHGQQRLISTSTFDMDASWDTPISKTCRQWVERWDEMRSDNMGILFYGSRGTGKSFYASCIVNEIVKRKVVAVMTTTANLMTLLSGTWEKETIMDAIGRVPLLALDDLGAERDTSYSAELLYNIINTRYNSRQPTIITTNIDISDLKSETEMWRSRIYDRVIEMCPIAIPMSGMSRREGIADERKRKAREMLDWTRKGSNA